MTECFQSRSCGLCGFYDGHLNNDFTYRSSDFPYGLDQLDITGQENFGAANAPILNTFGNSWIHPDLSAVATGDRCNLLDSSPSLPLAKTTAFRWGGPLPSPEKDKKKQKNMKNKTETKAEIGWE